MRKRSLTPDNAELFARIRDGKKIRELELQTILWKIGASADAASVFPLLCYLERCDASLANLAIRTLEHLVESLPSGDLLWLDSTMMRASSESSYIYSDLPFQWDGRNPCPRGDLASRSLTMAGLCSFHGNGHVREDSLRRLSQSDGGPELRFILIRLNDWVPQVRELALTLAQKRLTPQFIPFWIQSLPLIAWLQVCRRVNHHGFIEKVLEYLQSPGSLEYLQKGLTSKEHDTRRLSYHYTWAHPGADRQALLRCALGEKDMSIRLWTARRIKEEAQEPYIAALLPLMRSNSLAAIRQGALAIIADRDLPGATADLTEALFDPSAVIRSFARGELEKRGSLDFRGLYRAELGNERSARRKTALAGLGETGIEEDREVILAYRAHEHPSLRKAAIRALRLLALPPDRDIFKDALRDEASGVSREAREALQKQVREPDMPYLLELFTSSLPMHCRKNALNLICRADKWQSLLYLLRARLIEDETVCRMVDEKIISWRARFNRSFTRPGREILDALSLQLDTCAPVLEHETARQLRFLISRW